MADISSITPVLHNIQSKQDALKNNQTMMATNSRLANLGANIADITTASTAEIAVNRDQTTAGQLRIAEGTVNLIDRAYQQTTDLLTQASSLAASAASSTATNTDRNSFNAQFTSILQQISNFSEQVKLGDQPLLMGTPATVAVDTRVASSVVLNQPTGSTVAVAPLTTTQVNAGQASIQGTISGAATTASVGSPAPVTLSIGGTTFASPNINLANNIAPTSASSSQLAALSNNVGVAFATTTPTTLTSGQSAVSVASSATSLITGTANLTANISPTGGGAAVLYTASAATGALAVSTKTDGITALPATGATINDVVVNNFLVKTDVGTFKFGVNSVSDIGIAVGTANTAISLSINGEQFTNTTIITSTAYNANTTGIGSAIYTFTGTSGSTFSIDLTIKSTTSLPAQSNDLVSAISQYFGGVVAASTSADASGNVTSFTSSSSSQGFYVPIPIALQSAVSFVNTGKSFTLDFSKAIAGQTITAAATIINSAINAVNFTNAPMLDTASLTFTETGSSIPTGGAARTFTVGNTGGNFVAANLTSSLNGTVIASTTSGSANGLNDLAYNTLCTAQQAARVTTGAELASAALPANYFGTFLDPSTTQGFIGGTVRDVQINSVSQDSSGNARIQISVMTDNQTFQGTLTPISANAGQVLTLTSTSNDNNTIGLVVNRNLMTSDTPPAPISTTDMQSALRVLFGVNNSGSSSLVSPTMSTNAIKTSLGITGSGTVESSFQLGVGMDSGTWALSSSYNAGVTPGVTDLATFTLTNGVQTFQTVVDQSKVPAGQSMSVFEAPISFSNGFQINKASAANPINLTNDMGQFTFFVDGTQNLTLSFPSGSTPGDVINMTLAPLTPLNLGLQGADLTNTISAQQAQINITDALSMLMGLRANAGAVSYQMAQSIVNLNNNIEYNSAIFTQLNDVDQIATLQDTAELMNGLRQAMATVFSDMATKHYIQEQVQQQTSRI